MYEIFIVFYLIIMSSSGGIAAHREAALEQRKTESQQTQSHGHDDDDDEGMLATHNVVVTPGSYICPEAGNLRGHGTYVQNGALYANVAGLVQRVNRLISVQPISSRYVGEVGDVVVGRIVEVGSKRWTVDVNARQHAILMLSSINLSGGVQRRRTTEDQLQMRSILSEHDLVSVSHSYPQSALFPTHEFIEFACTSAG